MIYIKQTSKIYILFCLFISIYSIQGSSRNIITNSEQSDGFGSQFQNIIATVVYAELNGFHYIYTPFLKMEHNYDNTADFLEKKEWLINFKDNFEINNGLIQRPPEGTSGIRQGKVYFAKFFDDNINECANSKSLQKIKNIFRANKNIHDYFDTNFFNIAIHVRRGNPHDCRPTTSPSDVVYLNIIDKLRNIYSNKNTLFHIHSQGNPDNYKIYQAKDIILHLNESTEDTFISMVLADVLVIAPSSLSYTAGLLSDGDVYCLPFWHKLLPHWKPINIDDVSNN